MGGSLIERQDNIVKNIDDRFANFDRASANEYLSELHRNDANKRSSAEISNEIQRQMRLMNPTAFAEPEEQTERLMGKPNKFTPQERLAKLIKQGSTIIEVRVFREQCRRCVQTRRCIRSL